MARRKAPTPLEGKVDFTPAPETTAPEFSAIGGAKLPAAEVVADLMENAGAPPTSPLEARIAVLEATVAALVFSTFGGRDSKGASLVRCRCGCFATRKVSVIHRYSGTHVEALCAACGPFTPLAANALSKVEEQPLLEPGDRVHVERANRGIVQAREWSAS